MHWDWQLQCLSRRTIQQSLLIKVSLRQGEQDLHVFLMLNAIYQELACLSEIIVVSKSHISFHANLLLLLSMHTLLLFLI